MTSRLPARSPIASTALKVSPQQTALFTPSAASPSDRPGRKNRRAALLLNLIRRQLRRLLAGIYFYLKDRISRRPQVFARHDDNEGIRSVEARIGKIPKPGPDDDDLAVLGSAQDRDKLDLHV